MASAGHSGSQSVQSMHSSGSMARKFGPSWKQSTGQTSTQSMYLHLMQFSVTTKVMSLSTARRSAREKGYSAMRAGRAAKPLAAAAGRSRPQAPVEGDEMMRFHTRRPILQVAPQAEFRAREGELRPGDL